MSVPRGTGASISAAGVLAAITLFVFFTLRDYGPRSALRRFNDDVRSGNVNDLQQVTVQQISDESVQKLYYLVRQIELRGGTSRVAALNKNRGEVEMLVLYSIGDTAMQWVWIVDHQSNGTWAVNADKTLMASEALPRLPF